MSVRDKRTPEETKANLEKLRHKFPPKRAPRDRTEPHHLPNWVKIAIVKHETQAKSWREIAEEFGKKPSTLGQYIASPAARALKQSIAEQVADTPTLVTSILRSHAVGIAIENIMHYEAAKKAGDLAEAGRHLRHLTEVSGAHVPKQRNESQGAQTFTLVIQNATPQGILTAEIPMGEATSEKVVDAEVVDE